ncbi:MAG TPA: trehalose-phosphatase [Actinomycetota bacterium]|nr:trehalose-phosphatase [Actinomycetota bacterium]
MDQDRIAPFREHPETAGLFIDFDGTLSEIVHVPSEARPVRGAREALDRLAARFRLVSIVSGRSAHQLLEWFGPHIEIWGVHGAERTHEGRVELSERAEPYADLMARVKKDAEKRLEDLGLEGVLLEDKGVMIGLHFRAARDQERARAALDELAEELARGYGLRRAGGRLAFELRPPVEFSKGQIVLHRAREASLKAVAFMGDDRVDIPGFDALDRLEREGTATLRVAVDSAEAPPELIERADVVVNGPAGALDFLERLCA